MIPIFGCLAVLFASSATGTSAPLADVAPASETKMHLTGLTPAKPMFDACVYRYSVGTRNEDCQKFVNQALGMYYSYVWIEAARAAETALTYDPECAYAWLVLHRSLEKWGRGKATPKTDGLAGILGAAAHSTLSKKFTKSPVDYSLEQASKLMNQASHREQLLIRSKLQEKGLWPDVKPDDRAKKAQESLDELLTLYADDQEGWFWRAQLAKRDNRYASTPFYNALLMVNPDHPGANHELVHYFENIRRPALGWTYAEGYMRSSPGLPHAFHMQAHLAMRIGKWKNTTDWSAKAVQLEMAYHDYQGVKYNEDHQFRHHLEILTRSLIHDGRFAEARELKAKVKKYNYTFRPEWFRMALSQKRWDEAEEIIDYYQKSKSKSNKAMGAYYAALMNLEKGETEQVARELDALQDAMGRRGDKRNERRLWEVQGLYRCQQGDGEAGLKLLKKLVDATIDDFGHHAWGNGAVYMEAWGVGALECGNAAQAEEAFQEALAHDTGSVRAALGMWALCERLGRDDEAARYLKVAQRLWAKADPKDFATLQADMTRRAANLSVAATTRATDAAANPK